MGAGRRGRGAVVRFCGAEGGNRRVQQPILYINFRHVEGGRLAPGGDNDFLRFHPCVLYRIESQLPSGATSSWSGIDDKCAVIHLVHVRSVKKIGLRWHLTDEL